MHHYAKGTRSAMGEGQRGTCAQREESQQLRRAGAETAQARRDSALALKSARDSARAQRRRKSALGSERKPNGAASKEKKAFAKEGEALTTPQSPAFCHMHSLMAGSWSMSVWANQSRPRLQQTPRPASTRTHAS